MDWLNTLVKEKTTTCLSAPVFIGVFSFLSNLFIALSDGKIDSTELHNLMSGASGIQTVILIIVVYFLKRARNDNQA